MMHTPTDAAAVVRGLNGAYARERLEEVIRAIAEDALNPYPARCPAVAR